MKLMDHHDNIHVWFGETLEELGLVGYQIDTFSSDYDEYIDESGMVYDAHGA